MDREEALAKWDELTKKIIEGLPQKASSEIKTTVENSIMGGGRIHLHNLYCSGFKLGPNLSSSSQTYL